MEALTESHPPSFDDSYSLSLQCHVGSDGWDGWDQPSSVSALRQHQLRVQPQAVAECRQAYKVAFSSVLLHYL